MIHSYLSSKTPFKGVFHNSPDPSAISSLKLDQCPDCHQDNDRKRNSQLPKSQLRERCVADVDAIHAEVRGHERKRQEDDRHDRENEDGLVVCLFADRYGLTQLFPGSLSVINLNMILGKWEIPVERTRFFLFCAICRSSVTLFSCFRMSCRAFASVTSENASGDLAVVLKSVRLPSRTVFCWRRMVSMIVWANLVSTFHKAICMMKLVPNRNED
jgi:hypothetical protein